MDVHVRNLLVFLYREAHDLLGADHVELVDTPLGFLTFQALRQVSGGLLIVEGLGLLQSADVLTHRQFFHHLFELRVKVRCKVSVDLCLDGLR